MLVPAVWSREMTYTETDDRSAAVSPPAQPSSIAARATGIAYTMPEGPLDRESTEAAPTSTIARSRRRIAGFVVTLSARSLKVGVGQISTFHHRRNYRWR